MTVGKIALGVFLGNLIFALLVWAVAAVMIDSRTSAENARDAGERLRSLQAEMAISNGSTPR